MGLLIKLTKSDMSLCRQASSLRWQLARASGIVNQRRDDRSDQDIDYLGIRAEAAVSKAYNVPYHPTSLGVDDGVDMYAGDVSIDVKSTFHTGGRLLLKSKAAAMADLFVLVSNTPEEDIMNILGWTTRDYFLNNCTEADFGGGGGFILPQSSLFKPEQLWLHLTKHHHGVAA